MPTLKNRKLAAILFADIVGYTALMQANEVEGSQQLTKFRDTLNEKVAAQGGKVIQYYGDGCLCTFDSAVDAMHCAKAVQKIFQTNPKVPVRIGLHSGDVFFEADNVFGDAVNIASRVESMGISGAVLLSSNVRNQIKNQPDFKLKSLGKFKFKNVQEGMTVYALANEGLAIPKQGEIKGKFKTDKAPKRSNWSIAFIGLLILSILGFFYFFQKNPFNKSPDLSNQKSIAVLPLKNWSGEENLEYFCDGITDEVIARLAKISAFEKVISRTSVFKYKDSNKSIPEIAEELGVNHILEGSFQKVGDQIKIKLQLIDATEDNYFWSEEYSGKWNSDDIFEIQASVAENVVQKMDISISPSELTSIKDTPTKNKEAYDLFLLAEYQRYKENEAAYFNAIPLYEKAIQLDPNFTRAYEGLGYIYLNGGLIWGIFSEQGALEKSTTYLKKAITIDSTSLARYNLFLAEFYFNWNFQYCETNLKYLAKMSDVSEESDISDYLVKSGRYDLAVNWIDTYSQKFPLLPYMYSVKAKTLFFAGRKEESKALLKVKDEIYTDDLWYLRESAMLHFYLGQYEASKEKVQIIKTNFSDRAPIDIWLNAVHAYQDKKWDSSKSYLDELFQKHQERTSGSPAWFISMYYFFIKDKENGFKWLQTSYELHEVEMTWLREELLLKPYRKDTRYQTIYKKMNWPQPIIG